LRTTTNAEIAVMNDSDRTREVLVGSVPNTQIFKGGIEVNLTREQILGKPILCMDFDGVIHSYVSGWTSEDHIPDPPVPGAMEFLKNASETFKISIFSSRSRSYEGRKAMQRWMAAQNGCTTDMNTWPKWLFDIEYPTQKPPAFISIDDRAIQFTGIFPAISQLTSFRTWNKRSVVGTPIG
jgi:hypothetical protein